MDLLCPSGSPDEELVLGGLPAALLIEPLHGEDGTSYCTRLRSPGQWGSTAEVLALTKVLQRSIRVHTEFGMEQYGDESEERTPLSVHFADSHYRAVTEPAGSEACSAATRLRGGATTTMNDDESTAAAVLDRLHASASSADADAYFRGFAPGAVFLGTDASERWPLAEFQAYATARFAKGDGWTYTVLERHITLHGDVAWFDERLQNAKLGTCRSSGVLVRGGEGEGGSEWRVAQFNLAMAIPNDKALEVAALVSP